MKFRREPEWRRLYGKMALIFAAACFVSALVFWRDNRRRLATDENGASEISRNGYGEGSRTEELQVKIGNEKERYTIEIEEQQYTEEELQKVFEEAEEKLEQIVKGENNSLDEVRKNLNLINQIPDTGIRISWELDRYDVMDMHGVLKTEAIPEEGVMVGLKAVMAYGEKQVEHVFYARVYPPELTVRQRLLKQLDEEVERLNVKTRERRNLTLPTDVDGQAVSWGYVKNFRAAGVLLLGMVLSILLYISKREKEKTEKRRREEELTVDYPKLVSTFTLFLGAGMSARNVWFRMAENYEKQREEKGRRAVYEEMLHTMYEIKSGGSESECYEQFGDRCSLPVYRKFGALLSQNLRKGTKGLAILLKQESENAFEERKNQARKQGEEAGTKLLLPMFLMLAVVLVIIVVPAFLSIQI